MRRLLLDVNVLIALIEPGHEYFDSAYRWFVGLAGDQWLTCPITENGAVRIVSKPGYRPGP